MRVAYFDCFCGVSGDMLLGALVDAGVGLEALQERLRLLGLHEFEVTAEKVTRGGIAGTKVSVAVTHSHDHHRHLADVLAIIESSDLPAAPKADAAREFRRLAEAEAKLLEDARKASEAVDTVKPIKMPTGMTVTPIKGGPRRPGGVVRPSSEMREPPRPRLENRARPVRRVR